MTSTYIKRGDTNERKAALLRGSLEDVARLEKALSQGWDVKADLAKAQAQVKAFTHKEVP